MAINLKHIVGTLRLQKDVATGYAFAFEREGVLAASVIESGVEKVRPAAATTGEKVVGFVISDSDSRTDAVMVETITVPSSGPYTVELKHDVLAGATTATDYIGVRASTTPLTQVDDATPATGEFDCSPTGGTDGVGLLTFNSAQAGLSYTATYRYPLSAAQRDALDYERSPSNKAGVKLGTVTVLCGTGEIYTMEYDPKANFSSYTTLETAADGNISTDGNVAGTDLTSKVRVIKLPDSEDPSLGLAFNF